MNIQHTITKKPLESDIKKKIKDLLEKNGWIVIMLIVSNKDGEPDVLALQNGARCVFIETKVPGKNPTPLQLFRHQQLRAKGFEVIVARDVEDVQHLIVA
jgi:NADPH:quinone reductase-like Zn-dependent oxidoreductase